MPGSRTAALGTVVTAALWIAVTGNTARAGGPPTLRPGAVEVGLSGTMTTVEGIVTGAIGVRGGYFWRAVGGLMGAEVSSSYRHISSYDEVDLEAAANWQRRVGNSGNYPFVALNVGVRREEIGSFGQTRYPLGFSLGMRALFGQRAGIRVEYAFRRILNDPVADFSEHRIVLGLSIVFRNLPRNGD